LAAFEEMCLQVFTRIKALIRSSLIHIPVPVLYKRLKKYLTALVFLLKQIQFKLTHGPNTAQRKNMKTQISYNF
jgi:hypothetical protein